MHPGIYSSGLWGGVFTWQLLDITLADVPEQTQNGDKRADPPEYTIPITHRVFLESMHKHIALNREDRKLYWSQKRLRFLNRPLID